MASPRAIGSRCASRWASVPCRAMGRAAKAWPWTLSATAPLASAIRSTTRQYERKSEPSPPCSSGSITPRRPRSPAASSTSRGNSSVSSIASARGSTTSSAKASARSRSSRCSSVRTPSISPMGPVSGDPPYTCLARGGGRHAPLLVAAALAPAMGKVSIGLRGWRFDEADVFADDGGLRPVGEMDPDVARRVVRLSALVGSPCDACWLEHGDEGLDRCAPAEVVYGEPLAEVLLCPDHEADFLYWFREADGEAYRGTEALQDAFHGWYLDGGRAPEGYGGLEHVDTDPADLPRPPPVDQTALAEALPDDGDHDVDLRSFEAVRREEG